MQQHVPSVHNRTQTLTDEDRVHYTKQLLSPLDLRASPQQTDIVVHADCHDVLPMLQPASVNLLILDPPYNLTKTFNDSTFSRSDTKEYAEWFESW
ncbi:MAG: site-specific DNA-methyltransferase, partial [Candidatus Kapabacteria bacterium]|nr:site-specific DNA-methyltransferase [Candidatus Kapabacteria bacterium]